MNFEHIYGDFNEQAEVDLSYLEGEQSQEVKVEVSQKDHLKMEESRQFDESEDASVKMTRTGNENNRQWRKKRQTELKAQIKGRFYSLYTELKRGPPVSEKLCQEILNEVSLRGLSVLGLEELARYFEKLLTKSVVNPRYGKKNWTEEETEFLISLVAYYTHIRGLDYRSIEEDTWEFLGSVFPTKGYNLVRKKWMSMLKANLSKHPWSQREDELLTRVIGTYGTDSKWKKIAEEFNKLSDTSVYRHSKQCRERWINHLDPSIKRGEWNDEDDVKLLMGVVQIGRKWSEIAKLLGDRTENAVKNRWHSLTKMYRSLRNPNDSEDGSVETVEQEFAFAVLEEIRRTKKIELPVLIKEENKSSITSLTKSQKEDSSKSPLKSTSSMSKMKSMAAGRKNLLEQNLALDEQKVKKEENSLKKATSILNPALNVQTSDSQNKPNPIQPGLLSQTLAPIKTTRHSHSALEGLYPQNLPYPTNQNFPFEGAPLDPLKSNLMQATNPLQLPFLPRHQHTSSFSYSTVQGSQTQSALFPMINGLPYYGNNPQPQISNPAFFPQPMFQDKTVVNNPMAGPLDTTSESFSSTQSGPTGAKNLREAFNNRKWELSTKKVDINALRFQITSPDSQVYFALIDFKESEIHLLDRATLNNYQQSLDIYNKSKKPTKDDQPMINNLGVPVRESVNQFNTQHNTFSSVFSQNNLVVNPFIPNLLKNQPNYPYPLNQNNRPPSTPMYPRQEFEQVNNAVYPAQFNLMASSMEGREIYPQEGWQQNLE